MKIKSIKIENHKVLGNLDLDFTDRNGNIYDTVIFIGENGCGKTTILDFIYKLFQTKGSITESIHNDCNYTVALSLTEEELNKINNKIKIQNPNIKVNLTNDLTIQYTGNETNDINLKYKIDGVEINNYIAPTVHAIETSCIVIYSPAQTNLISNAISQTTGMRIDGNVERSIKASENLGMEIKQLFVDIESQDSSDTSNWIKQNRNKIVPDEVIDVRIKRFCSAFQKIFHDTLYFDRVETTNNLKEVFFKNNNEDISIDNLSSGQKQIVYRGAFLLKDKNSINGAVVLVDEPELSMHAKWQIDMLDYYKFLFHNNENKQTSQLFISSHSEYIFKAKTDKDLVLILHKNGNFISIKPYEEQNILPFKNFAENKYFAFDIPTAEFFNELYAYVCWKKNMKFDDYIASIKTQILPKYINYCNLILWKKDNGKQTNITPITYIRHEIHHPENKLNARIYNTDNDLREPIEFLIYLIKNFNI